MKVKILGVENSRRNEVEGKVRNTLKKLSMKAEVEIISIIDDILQYEIAGIPAVLVNDKVVFEVEIPEEKAVFKEFTKIQEKLAQKKLALSA